MTRELIISGQHVDLEEKTDVTLKYANNILGDIGKLELSHSYTIKIPRSARNDMILGMPNSPGHTSNELRRFLDCHFYRNGIDLLGDAQAYVLRTTPEHHEITLVKNDLPELWSLSQSKATLNDLPELPVMEWIGPNGSTPDYTPVTGADAFFALYNAGLGSRTYPEVNAATHPCVRLSFLLDQIMGHAGIPYSVSNRGAYWLHELVLLAAPSHKPTDAMERGSGNTAEYVSIIEGTSNNKPFQYFDIVYWATGWDPLTTYGIPASAAGLATGALLGIEKKNAKIQVLLNWRMPAAFAGASIIIEGLEYNKNMDRVTNRSTLLQVTVKSDSKGCYVFADETLQTSGWEYCGIRLDYDGDEFFTENLSVYDDSLPLSVINYVHETLDIAKNNHFPLEGNLPDIGQWDFVKSCMALLGLVPVIQDHILHFADYSEMLSTENAYDWTRKVDMTEDPETSYALDSWAQSNRITFQESPDLSTDQSAILQVEDTTLQAERDWYELPYAASEAGNAQHYKIDDNGKVQDVDIAPRIFQITTQVLEDGSHVAALIYPQSMRGAGLRDTIYKEAQEVVRKPVAMTCNVRLNELDLASLDLRRTVYLGQYGQYYAIKSIQTSATDLCKVELIQIP